jgi:hypothetical protein
VILLLCLADGYIYISPLKERSMLHDVGRIAVQVGYPFAQPLKEHRMALPHWRAVTSQLGEE